MTEREAPPNRGFDYRQDDPYEYDGWFGSAQVAEPVYEDDGADYSPSEPVDYVAEERFTEARVPDERYEPPHELAPPPVPAAAAPAPVPAAAPPPPVEAAPPPPVPAAAPPPPVPAAAPPPPVPAAAAPPRAPEAAAPRPVPAASTPPPHRRVASPTVNTWTVNGQLRASSNSTLEFRSPPPPWYRTKQARIALVSAVSAAVVVPIVLLVWPDGASTGPQQSTSVAPEPSTTTQPAPSIAPSTPVNEPPPPAPPPPPPPPPPPEDTAPPVRQPYWTRPAAPQPTQEPDVGVTRTPVTRAPISVAPVPRRPPDNHVGESDKPGCAGWC